MSYFNFAISIILLAAILLWTATQLENHPCKFLQIIGSSKFCSLYDMSVICHLG